MKLINIKDTLTEFFTVVQTPMNKKFDVKNDIDDTIVLPNSEEAELPLFDKNFVSYTIDFDADFRTIKDLILVYRDIAADHKVEDAIDEIVNEAIVVEDNKNNISIDLDNIDDITKNVKNKITDEFDNILKLLNFKREGSEIFRQWYIDGRIWFQVLFNKNQKAGISTLRKLSPLDITRIKEEDEIWYIYKEDEKNKNKRRISGTSHDNRKFDEGLKISAENIAFVPSGLKHAEKEIYISNIHKAIKPLNQLRLLEDSAVIYRITRAPERRVFYIDVGPLPKTKAESYVKSIMNQFKSSISYDTTTGKVSQSKKVMTMLEDFYLPSRGDSKGTKVDTLQGGTQLGEIEDIRYFHKELLSSLKVPYSRLDTQEDADVNIGQPSELSRPELKFQNFIQRLRSNFSILFFDLLKTQLITKGIMKVEDWEKIKNDINFVWQSNNYFNELKENEILTQRLELLSEIKEHIGTFFSTQWVKENILRQSENDIEQMDKEINTAKEKVDLDNENDEE